MIIKVGDKFKMKDTVIEIIKIKPRKKTYTAKVIQGKRKGFQADMLPGQLQRGLFEHWWPVK